MSVPPQFFSSKGFLGRPYAVRNPGLIWEKFNFFKKNIYFAAHQCPFSINFRSDAFEAAGAGASEAMLGAVGNRWRKIVELCFPHSLLIFSFPAFFAKRIKY